jgi:hypothetical protein
LLLPIYLGLQLLLLRLSGGRLLFAFLAASLIFSERDHSLQGRLRQALEWMDEAQLALPQYFFTGLECLGEPGAPMRTLQGLSNATGMAQ